MEEEQQLIALPEVQRIMGLSKSEIWRRAKSDSTFPKPVRLGARCTRWSLSEVRGWVTGRLASRSPKLIVDDFRGVLAPVGVIADSGAKNETK